MSAQESADQQQTLSTTTDSQITSQQATSQQATPQNTRQEDFMMETPDSPPDLYAHNYFSSDTPVTSPTKSAATQDKVNHGAPGSSWNSKKFREEYERVWDTLVDKNWDGKTKYGDPLLEE
ncbi:hypothetical protein NHQ30_006974 [Ciborinia camelliae]|nr:hypothetical protein NHQ30_006974 [Ciborinia camelliae]